MDWLLGLAKLSLLGVLAAIWAWLASLPVVLSGLIAFTCAYLLWTAIVIRIAVVKSPPSVEKAGSNDTEEKTIEQFEWLLPIVAVEKFAEPALIENRDRTFRAYKEAHDRTVILERQLSQLQAKYGKRLVNPHSYQVPSDQLEAAHAIAKQRNGEALLKLTYDAAETEWRDDIHRKLENGVLVANGMASPLMANTQTQEIPAYQWRILRLDTAKDEATGEGLKYVGVRLRRVASEAEEAFEHGFNKATFERNKGNAEAAVLRLAQLRTEGVKIRNEAGYVDDTNLQEWLGKLDTWMHEVLDAIRAVSAVDAELFRTLDVVTPARLQVPIRLKNQLHVPVFVNVYNQHDLRLVRLKDLLEKYQKRA